MKKNRAADGSGPIIENPTTLRCGDNGDRMLLGHRTFAAGSLVVLASIGAWVQIRGGYEAPGASRPASAEAAVGSGTQQVPSSLQGIHWYENLGQWQEEIRYGMSVGGAWVGVTDAGIVLQFSGASDGEEAHRVELQFEGASSKVLIEGLKREPGVHHAYLGNDPTKWVRNVRSFQQVKLTGLYEGIDLVLKQEQGRLKYDVYVAANVDLDQLVFRVEGVAGLEVQADGSLVIDAPGGAMRHPSAISWEGTGKNQRSVEVQYRLIDEARFGFEAPDRNPSLPLVIDPELLWSTFWGGVGTTGSIGDKARDVALDSNGDVTVVGTVEGVNSLMTPGAFQAASVVDDLFVAKFHQATGKLIYSARIGSSVMDEGQAVAVGDQGRATVVGWAGQGATDFPTTAGAFDPVTTAFRDAGVVFRLSPKGDVLEYSTFLESTNGVHIQAVALAPSGAAIVAGDAFSDDYPTTPGAFDEIGGSAADAFITRLDPTGSFLEWSTFMVISSPSDLQIDAQENVYVTGIAGLGYPVTPAAFQTQANGTTESFVTKLAADGTSLVWSTYLGGDDEDWALGLNVLPGGDVIVVGRTESTTFPVTPGAFQEILAGSKDVFVTRLDSTGSSLVFSTYIGTITDDWGFGVTTDASGLVTAVGTAALNYPTTPGAFDTNPISLDTFVTRLLPDGSGLLYSTFFGGNSSVDLANAVATSPNGLLTVVGRTASAEYPITPNALFPSFIGGQVDSCITTFYPLLQGVSLDGESRPSCLGPLQLNATTMPLAGQPFGVYCSQAPPNAKGVLVVRERGGRSVYPVLSDADGFVVTSLGNLPSTPGAVLWCRYMFRNTPACSGAGPRSTSNLLRVELQ